MPSRVAAFLTHSQTARVCVCVRTAHFYVPTASAAQCLPLSRSPLAAAPPTLFCKTLPWARLSHVPLRQAAFFSEKNYPLGAWDRQLQLQLQVEPNRTEPKRTESSSQFAACVYLELGKIVLQMKRSPNDPFPHVAKAATVTATAIISKTTKYLCSGTIPVPESQNNSENTA